MTFPVSSNPEIISAFLGRKRYIDHMYVYIYCVFHIFQSHNLFGEGMFGIWLNRLSHKEASLPVPQCSICFVTKEHFGERVAAQSQPKKTTTSYSSNFIQSQPWSHQPPDLENKVDSWDGI